MVITMNERVYKQLKQANDMLNNQYEAIDRVALKNKEKVLDAFNAHQLSESDLNGTSGYGYDDIGRDKLESIYAEIFNAEDAFARYSLVSGTHAIYTALNGLLNYGDELMYITGDPYDTLHEVIGISGHSEVSFIQRGMNYQSIDLLNDKIDVEKVIHSINSSTKVIAIQRSRGYSSRPSIPIKEIETCIQRIKSKYPDVIIFVDNCYGEFVEEQEPTDVGADIVAGSLIKNLGAGIAEMGGYIVGRESLIQRISETFISPGIGKEVGASLNQLKDMYLGLFLAPSVVKNSLKGAILIAYIMEQYGYKSYPKSNAERTDIVQAIQFDDKERLIEFCQYVQRYSPVNSHVTPVPSELPGYSSEVIMAAGTFTQGSSIELSADAPIKSPYIAYIQGGLTFEHVELFVMRLIERYNKIR